MIAVPLGFLSILTLSIFVTLTSSQIYKDSLIKSEVYAELSNPTKYIEADNDDFQLFVGPLVEQFDVPLLAQTTLESNIDYLTTWIKGEDELYLYFPVEEIKSRFQSDEFSQAVLNAFEVNYSNLNECSDEELANLENESDSYRAEGNFLPPCKPPNFEEEFETRKVELQSELDEILKSDETFEEVLKQADLEFISEKTPYTTFITEVSQEPEDAQKQLENFDQIQNILSIVRVVPIVGVLVSLMLVCIVALSIKHASFIKMLKVILNNFVLIGFLLIIVAISLILIRQVGIDQIPFDDISKDEVYTSLELKLEVFVRTLSLKAVTQISIISFGLFGVSMLLRIVLIVFKQKPAEQVSTQESLVN